MTYDVIARLNTALEGRYRIERELGEGGMATVYLAADLRHERRVALKVLKPALAAVVGADRFLAEIKTTANLQHPHILPLFDSGEADGFLFYVMPYVPGESLRERLDRESQLPVDEAVRIAVNVAEALEYAHRQGVIHRDIKPANILLQAGKPVVSDFGIALAVGAAGGGRLTETGLSVGTPHYMSPEQAMGEKSVGPASDLYALGCVLYEMLVGEPPYTGSTAQAILGKIIQGEPVSATKARRTVPLNVDAALRKALEKLPADRFASVEAFARALADPGFRWTAGTAVGRTAVTTGAYGTARWGWTRLTTAFAGLFAIAAVALVIAIARGSSPTASSLARFPDPFLRGQFPTNRVEFTPDGSGLVFVSAAESGTGSQLWMRRWDDLTAVPLRGSEMTGGGMTFAISPDGSEVAFTTLTAQSPLQAIPLLGGPARTIAPEVTAISDWGEDGYIYLTYSSTPTARMGRVLASGSGGGVIQDLAELAEREIIHGSALVLPGGRYAVFQVWYQNSGEGAELWALDLETLERRFLIQGTNPRYAASGHLLYGTTDGVVYAAPIDPRSAELTAPSVPVLENVLVRPPFGTMDYAISPGGSLLYRVGAGILGSQGQAELVWVTRGGQATPVDPSWTYDPGIAGGFGWQLSPDERRIATTRMFENNMDIWVKELPSGPFDRLTTAEADDRFPTWSPDGAWVTYSEGQQGGYRLWQRRADGTGAPELLLEDGPTATQSYWSPDGEWLVFATADPATRVQDVMGFRPGTDAAPVPLVASPEFAETEPAISPDGRWLAYVSDESGRDEIYVRPFPDVESGRVRASTDGGVEPLWSRDGTELFFVDAASNVVAAQVDGSARSPVLGRQILFSVAQGYGVRGGSAFIDVSADGERFLMARPAGMTSAGVDDDGGPGFVLVQNFFEELRRLAPN